MNEEKAFEAYKQLASYLQEKDCYPREKNVLTAYFICIIIHVSFIV